MTDDTTLDNFPFVDLDSYQSVDAYRTGFATGAAPNWITTSITGGGAVTYQTTDGGRAQVRTGTGATDDTAIVQFAADIVPQNHDLLVLTVYTEGPHEWQVLSNQTRFRADTNNNIRLMREYDYLNYTGTNYRTPFKDYTNGPIEQKIVWDIEQDRAWALTGGLSTNIHAPVSEDPALSYDVDFLMVSTKDTTADRVVYLYGAELELYNR